MYLKSFTRKLRLLTIIFLFISLAGCWGNGSGPGSTPDANPPVLTGILVNAEISGADWNSSSDKSGTTNSGGEYNYSNRDTTTFSIGDIILGVVQAQGLVTPVELTGSSDPLDPDAIRLMQFLQSIDADQNYSTGISISDSTRSLAEGIFVDFSDPNFGVNNPDFDLQALVNAVTEPDHPVVSAAEALENFRQTYENPKYGGEFDFPFPASFQLAWADEFTAPDLDTENNWNVETGYGFPTNNPGWGNDEWQLYTGNEENLAIVFGQEGDQSNGYLKISAQCPSAPNCGKRTDQITSAKINTKDKHEFTFGKIEARIKVPTGKGAWPAFWSLGANFPDTPWPAAGEIDFMEVFSADNSTDKEALFSIHWEQTDGQGDRQFITSKRMFDASQFHVFSAEWDEHRIVGKIDGVIYANYDIDPETQSEFLRPFYLILNVAMGGNPLTETPPDATTPWPQTMLVDWVRVYQAVGEFGAPIIDIDFEGPSEFVEFCDAGTPPCGATGFAGADVSVQPNPEINEDNPSATAARFLKFDPMNGQLFSGTVVILADDLQNYLEQSNKIFTMKVWSSRPVGVEFILQTTPGNGPRKIVTTSGNGWEEFTFDFSNDNFAGVTNLVMLFGNGETYSGDANDDLANGTTQWTFYFDDIILQSSDDVGDGGDGGDGGGPPFNSGLLTNGDFEDGIVGWLSGVNDPIGAENVVNENGNNVYFVDVDPAGEAFDVNLSQKLSITPDETYRLTFKAKSDRARSIFAGIGLSDGSFTSVEESVDLITVWQTYTVELTPVGFGDADSRVLFDMGAEVGQVFIDDVSLVVSAGGGGGDGGLAVNGSFETGDFTGWTQFGSMPGNVDQMVDLGVPGNTSTDGSFHAHIINSVTETNSLIKNANIGIGTVTPNSPYTITFDARGSYAVPGGVAFAEFFSELAGEGVSKAEILGGQPLAINADPEVWTSFTFTGTTGPDVSGGVTLQLGAITGAGDLTEMFFDNIVITVGP